jgi:hypothetical protein
MPQSPLRNVRSFMSENRTRASHICVVILKDHSAKGKDKSHGEGEDRKEDKTNAKKEDKKNNKKEHNENDETKDKKNDKKGGACIITDY